MKEKLIIAIMAIVIFVLLGYILFYPKPVKYVYAGTELRDTIVSHVIQYPEPVEISGKAKIIYRKIEVPVVDTLIDTLFLTKPFTAELDTVAVKDTFKIRFDYPENIFSFSLRKEPKEIEIKTIMITKEVEKPEAWYIKPAWIAGSLIIGYGLGSIK